MNTNLAIERLQYALDLAFCRKTSAMPKLWTTENPAFGQCGAAVLVVQEILGGKINYTWIPGLLQKVVFFRDHYWNCLPDGKAWDFTRSQFPKNFPHQELIEGRLSWGRVNDVDLRRLVLPDNPIAFERFTMLMDRVRQRL